VSPDAAASGVLVAGRFRLALGRPLVMGVVNVTPDSFSDGGKFFDAKAAVAHARRLAEEGADILDIGGESSRPGALPVSIAEELDRVLPVLEGLKGIEKPLSVDTRRPEVMQAALRAGASMINDIEALQAPGALQAMAKAQCAVCLMHMKGEPATMQQEPRYDDVVVMNPDAYQWVETGTPGVSTKLLGTFTERNTQIGFIKVDAGATFNTGSRSQIEVLFMSRGNVTVNGRTYGEKTAIELLPSDGPVDIKANEESLFFTVTLPKL